MEGFLIVEGPLIMEGSIIVEGTLKPLRSIELNPDLLTG